MPGKKQQSEQEELRAATAIMIRALSILAAIAALAVSAAPASASCCTGVHYCAYTPKAGDNSTKPPARCATDRPMESISMYVKAARPKQPRAMVTPSGGEILSDWVKAPPKPRRQDGGSGSDAQFGDTPGLNGSDMS